MRRISCAFLIFMFGISLGGCYSFSNYQTAQVFEKGQGQFLVGLTSTSVNVKSTEEQVTYDESITYPSMDIMIRYALLDRFELGVKTYTLFFAAGGFSNFVVDAKYQFLDTDRFDMAVDYGVSFNRVEDTDTDPVTNEEVTEKIDYFDQYPAVLATYNLSETFSVTLAPKMIKRRITSSINPTETETITGATLTLAIGKKFKIYPEYGVYKSRTFDVTFAHYGIGFGFGF